MQVALTFDAEHSDRPTFGGGWKKVTRILDYPRSERHSSSRVAGRRPFPHFPPPGHPPPVGNHSHYHARMPMLSAGSVRRHFPGRVRHSRHTKVDPRPWFRCPFGAGASDPRITEALERRATPTSDGTSLQTMEEGADRCRIVRDVANQIGSGGGGLCLMHSAVSHCPRPSAFDRQLRIIGATFVGVDDLPFPPRIVS